MLQSPFYSLNENACCASSSLKQEALQAVESGFRSIESLCNSVKSGLGLTNMDRSYCETQVELTSISNRNINEWIRVGKRQFNPTGIPETDRGITITRNPYDIDNSLLTDSMRSQDYSLTPSPESLYCAEEAKEDAATTSLRSHLSLSPLPKGALEEKHEKLPYTSYWPRDILKTYVHNLSKHDRQKWMDRVRDWGFKISNTIRQQVVFNGYKFLCKACFFLLSMQMPQSIGDAFDMLDHEKRLCGMHRPF